MTSSKKFIINRLLLKCALCEAALQNGCHDVQLDRGLVKILENNEFVFTVLFWTKLADTKHLRRQNVAIVTTLSIITISGMIVIYMTLQCVSSNHLINVMSLRTCTTLSSVKHKERYSAECQSCSFS